MTNPSANKPAAPFGSVFASKMAIDWYRNDAWQGAEVQPLQNFSMHPAAHVLHYGSTCFEGMKAYRGADNQVRIFRLQRHSQRMQASAKLLYMPVPDADKLQEMIKNVVAACRSEVPAVPGALYIRPTLIGCENNIGAAAHPSREACLYVLLSPVGDYFAGGGRPLKILLDDQHMRAAPGFGMAKAGGNYASALRHIMQARADYQVDQVLFCPDGDVQETGASNFLLINDRQILTKPLDESFLHGVTRDSILTLAKDLGYEVIERNFQVEELLDWISTGEAALSGTAAVLAGIGSFVYRGKEIPVGNGGTTGPNTQRLRQALTDIQTGASVDKHGWITQV